MRCGNRVDQREDEEEEKEEEETYQNFSYHLHLGCEKKLLVKTHSSIPDNERNNYGFICVSNINLRSIRKLNSINSYCKFTWKNI
jgi:hypothetical protein